jgi:hypothetical protein
MASIERFIRHNVFDPDATQLLGRAFDMACALVGHTPQPAVTRELVAKAIFEAAQRGERDPHRLRDAGLNTVEDQILKFELRNKSQADALS